MNASMNGKWSYQTELPRTMVMAKAIKATVLPRFVPGSAHGGTDHHNLESKMNLMRTVQYATLIFVGALSGAALASDGTDLPRATTVRFSDLNLNSPAGVAALYGRIGRAAIKVCDDPAETRALLITRAAYKCRAAATDRAVRQANQPALTTIHLAKISKGRKPIRLAHERS